MPERAINRWVCLLVVALGCGLALAGTGRADNAQPTLTTETPTQAAPSFSAAVTANAVSSASLTAMPDVSSWTVASGGPSLSYVSREASCHDVLYAYRVDSADGSINGILPGDPAWPSAVDSRSPQLVFDSSSSGPGSTIALNNFQAGDIIAFRFVGCLDTYYSFPQANPGGSPFVAVSYDDTTQTWQLGWEDWGFGSDFNDMIVNLTGVQAGGSSTPPADTTPPTVALTAPADGAEVSQTIPVSATASDDVAVAGVQFQLDGQNLGDEVMSSPYSVPWDTTTADDGSHTLTAIAYDSAGNASAPASVQVLVANDVLDGAGDEVTVGPVTGDIQPKTGGCGGAASTTDAAVADAACSASSWCSSKNETVSMIQTMDSQPIEYHNRITHLTYWRARASVLVCENNKKGIITDFKESSATVTPLYALHVGPIPVWHYDNRARWTFGATGSKAVASTAQVTDSFTGCPFGLPIGCNTVTFTVHFELNGNGTYRYSLSYQGA